MPTGNFRFFILPIAIVLLIASQSLFVIARAWRRQGRLARCGGCNYDISGGDTWRCPECGGDLRHLGITTPALRSRQAVSLWQIAAAWLSVIGLAYILAIGVGATGSYPWIKKVDRRLESHSSRVHRSPSAPGLELHVSMKVRSESEPYILNSRMPGWRPLRSTYHSEAVVLGETLAEGERDFTATPSGEAVDELNRAVLIEAVGRLAERGQEHPASLDDLIARGRIVGGKGSIRLLDSNYVLLGRRLPEWVTGEVFIALAGVPFLLLALLGIAMTQIRRRWLIRQGKRDAERAMAARTKGESVR